LTVELTSIITANILLDMHWNAKLADFGTARPSQEGMTRRVGTTRWMAPEVGTVFEPFPLSHFYYYCVLDATVGAN